MKIHNHRLVDTEFRPLQDFGDTITPKFIVIHYTAGGDIDGAHSALEAVGLSAHLLVGRDGTTIQAVDFNRKAYHAGKSYWRGFRYLNSHSIGIEVCNYGWLPRRGDGKFQRSDSHGTTPAFDPDKVIVADHKNGWPRGIGWEIYPPDQLESLNNMCKALLNTYPGIREIVGHDNISPDRKQDPGPAMPMDSLQILTEEREERYFGTAYEVTARSGLNVRAGPGTDHSVVSVLPYREVVTVVDDSQTWYPLDIQNDEAIDGFVHSSFMRLASGGEPNLLGRAGGHAT